MSAGTLTVQRSDNVNRLEMDSAEMNQPRSAKPVPSY